MCSNLFKLVRSLFNTCSNVFKLVQNPFKCVQTCSNLFKTCSNVFKCVQTCSKPVQMCSNGFKLVQNLLKWVQMCSNGFKTCSNVSNVFQPVQNLFKCVQNCSKIIRVSSARGPTWQAELDLVFDIIGKKLCILTFFRCWSGVSSAASVRASTISKEEDMEDCNVALGEKKHACINFVEIFSTSWRET